MFGKRPELHENTIRLMEELIWEADQAKESEG